MPDLRAATLWPLPGGSGEHLTALTRILEWVRDLGSTRAVMAAIVGGFPNVSSTKTAESYLRVPSTLGLVEIDGPVCDLTDHGAGFLDDHDPARVKALLVERVAGVSELLRIMDSGARSWRIGVLLERMQQCGFRWDRPNQVRNRLRWLEEVGAVGREGDRRSARYFLIKEAASDGE